jgi:GPH family glycoside/pentoside/hexuronide:cation symporter
MEKVLQSEHLLPKKLPLKIKVAYALGQLGWSILSGIIQVWLVWFYNPPAGVNIPEMVPRNAVFGFLTVIGLITMVGRFMDGITDPWIASLSDRSKNPKGRRIPFMAKAVIPFTALTVLVFFMPTQGVSTINIIWLTVSLLTYYLFYTMYVAPYFALTSELGYTEKDRLDLSTYIALTWFIGYIIASGASFIWPIFEGMGMPLVSAIRLSLGILAIFGFIFMIIPVLMIDERKYVTVKSKPSSFKSAIKSAFQNKNFVLFEIFFLAYGIAITIFQTGNVYYVTVLLGFDEGWVMIITAITGILAFILYPVVNLLTPKVGKKKLCFFAMIMLIIAYLYCAFLGAMPLPPTVQAFIFVFFAGIGFAIFGILPNAIVADIAKNDGDRTGEYKEGMFFAVQTFMNKLGQMIAMVVFSSILLLGKDPGNDMGIRLTGIVAAMIGFAALMIFTKFRDE